MGNLKNTFLNEYSQKAGLSSCLPAAITAIYEVSAYLKDNEEKQIYLLRARADGREYLLKCTSRFCKEDLKSEYLLLSTLNHAGVPRAVFYFEHGDFSYLVREYIAGQTLEEFVDKKGGLSAKETVRIILRLCEILCYLHQQSPPIIHRDIKPQNIILSADGKCSLIDLGISRRYRESGKKDTVFMGTEATAAPEQFGYMQTDTRSDIYSLGVLTFYLITGSFDIQKLDLYKIDSSLKSIIKKCIRFSPEDRFTSVVKLKSRLEQYLDPHRTILKIAIPVALVAVASVFLLLLKEPVILPSTGSGTLPPNQTGAISSNEPDALSSNEPDALSSNEPDTPGGVVAFKSPLIEKAVLKELGKAEGDSVTYEELQNVTKLLICGETIYSKWGEHRMYGQAHHLNNTPLQEQSGHITSLDDLALMKNLSELALYEQNITDLSPLKDLKLTHLGLGSNSIRDISVLKGMDSLTILNIADNPITDITPLGSLSYLNELDISSTTIMDISPLSGMQITNLSILDTPIADYSPLMSLPRLEELRGRGIGTDGINVITRLTFLKRLTLYNCGINDLGIFASLPVLEYLDVFANKIESIKNIDRLAHLWHIGMGGNQITDLSPIAALQSLTSIDINSMPSIKDYEPLAQLPGLIFISCSKSQEDKIKAVLGDSKIQLGVQN